MLSPNYHVDSNSLLQSVHRKQTTFTTKGPAAVPVLVNARTGTAAVPVLVNARTGPAGKYSYRIGS